MRNVTVRRRRQRLDHLLVERGLAETRARAQALILAGKVRVGAGDSGRYDRKAGDLIESATEIEVAEPEPYVSRGGHKLAAALDAFGIDPAGLVCLDAGASTGGFTDVLLQRGAARIYAVDVGRGQLADAIARDPRVVIHDRTNARTLTAETLGEPIDLAVVDVSFISLTLVLAPIASAFLSMAVSRKREYLADASGVQLTRYPPGLISALEKLKDDHTSTHFASKATAHLWIEEPLDKESNKGASKLNHLFDTHPPIDDRIHALEQM